MGTSTMRGTKRTQKIGDTRTQNRSALLFTCAPLAALAAFVGISGIAQKQVQARESTVRYGQLTARDAQTTAKQNLTQLLGTAGTNVKVESASPQEGVLFRRDGQVQPITTRSWDVTLSTDTAEYLVRMNADTKQIFAVNRFDAKANLAPEDDGNVEDSVSLPSLQMQNKHLLSQAEGEIFARQCLRKMDIPITRSTVLTVRAVHSHDDSTNATPLWEFSYKCHTAGWSTRKLRICIDRRTGHLENIWNPAAVLTAS